MATVTPTSFRAAIRTRMRDSGTEYTDAQIDAAGTAAFLAAFPALYQRTRSASVAVTENTTTGYGSLTVTDSSKVYMLRDVDTGQHVLGWSFETGTTLDRVTSGVETVHVYSIAPYTYPTVSTVIPDEWLDALYSFAEFQLIEQLLNDGATFRGLKVNSRSEQPDEITLSNLMTQKYNRWERERDERAMSLPPVFA